MSSKQSLPSSFRDPSGFIFVEDGVIYRQINHCYRSEFERLIESGLYKRLTEEKLLLPHEEVAETSTIAGAGTVESEQEAPDSYKVIRPERVPFISYPYEWSFSQLKDAALLTLSIQKIAIEHGMTLKDASAFNVQFLRGKPIFIDTLSFTTYEEGLPWVAYKQFCQHFLAPLALMAHCDLRLHKLFRPFIDGIPLDLAVNILPKTTLIDLGLLTHIHMQAKFQQKYSKQEASSQLTDRKLSKTALLGIVESLEATVKGLRLKGQDSFWRNYYQEHNYSDAAFQAKKAAVEEYLEQVSPQTVWDLGANTGIFSRLASNRNIFTLSTDMDALVVEANYLKAKEDGDKNLLPLVVDLTAPAPAIGWANAERMSFGERGPADAALALALIHHLAIGNNVPLRSVADYMSTLTKNLIIEFVPKEDSQVRELLRMREDAFPDYHQESFERAFETRFVIRNKTRLGDSERTLYLMERSH
ncbi:hypothetical protein KF728_01155 [Candidatus Obscuribacterales bacterium]|nr:hypothetical protein [Candidatus Obscuribacterales bacterium]